MIKKFIMLAIVVFPMFGMAQNEVMKKNTKYEDFISQSGHITKYVDKKMEKCSYNINESFKVKLRMFYGENANIYYLNIEKGGSLGTSPSSAFILYSDLVEINKAFARLMSEVDEDRELKPEYLQNVYTSDDGFQVGYYVEKSKVKWIIRLEYGSYDIEFRKPEEIANYLIEAQKKIESIIAQNGK